jgi:hypothetical protein
MKKNLPCYLYDIRPFVHASVLSVLIFGSGTWLLGKPAPGLTQFKQKPPVAWIVCEFRQAQTFGRPLLIFLGCWHVTLSFFNFVSCITGRSARFSPLRLGPSKPLSHARVVLRCFGKQIVLAGFATEAQAPMMVIDKTKLSPNVHSASPT